MRKAGSRAPAPWEVVGVLLALLLGLALRWHDYALAPGFLDNADELQFAWAGLTLITQGDSFSWSYFPAYPSVTVFTAYGTSFPMVHHWLDHPPGFSLVVGGFAWLLGDRALLDVTAAQIRILPVAFATLSILLAYLLGRSLLGPGPALVGALLLATAPGAVLFSRQVEPESLLAPLLLGALIAVERITRGGQGRAWVGLLLGAALVSPFLKVPGLAVGGIAASILLVRGHWRLALAATAAALGGLLAYVAYGALVDWSLFQKIIQLQGQNRVGVMAAFNFIADAAGANRRLRDGWWLLGWIGVGLWLVAGRASRTGLLLAWPVVGYALTMAVLAGEVQVGQYGWYRIILHPLVYLAAGHLVWRSVTAPSLARLGIVLALGAATAAQLSLGRPWVPGAPLLALFLAVLLAPAALAAWRREPVWTSLAQAVAAVAVGAVILMNAVQSFYLAEIFTQL